MEFAKIGRRRIALYTTGVLICGMLLGAESLLFFMAYHKPEYAAETKAESERSGSQPHGFWTMNFATLMTVVFNGLLVVSTGGLWFHTARLASGAKEQTAETQRLIAATDRNAIAAQISADHIPNVERAYAFGGVADGGTRLHYPVLGIHLSATNYGKTPAICEEVGGQFFTVEPAGDTPTYDIVRRYDIVLSTGKPETVPEEFVTDVANLPGIFFAGYFRYRDIFGAIHTSRFCCQTRFGTDGRWIVAGSQAWNAWD